MHRDIYTVAKFGELSEFIELFDNEHINKKNSNGSSLLHYAISGNKFDIAMFLIDQGADINITNVAKQTPLHMICMNQNIEVARKLINCGADCSVKDIYGNTALWWAVFNSNGKYYDMVKLLSTNNFDPHIKNNKGISPIEFAEKIGDRILIDILDGSV